MEKIVKIYGGMDFEFELIKTNAPKELVEKQIKINCKKMENGEYIDNSYDYLEKNGYSVEFIGSHDTCDLEDFDIDYSLDMYDYWEE